MPKCSSCGAEIIWCVTVEGKRMPVDRAPSTRGNMQLLEQGDGPPLARVAIEPFPYLYLSHFATCPNASQHRKPRQGGLPGVA